MEPRAKLLYVVAGAAAVFVAVSSVVLAARQGSWGPVVSVAWLPGVVVAVWPGGFRRCFSRRGSQAG